MTVTVVVAAAAAGYNLCSRSVSSQARMAKYVLLRPEESSLDLPASLPKVRVRADDLRPSGPQGMLGTAAHVIN